MKTDTRSSPIDEAEYAVVRFYAQVWKNDYAVDVWDETYRVPVEDAIGDDGGFLETNTAASDQLRWHDDAPDRVQNWPETGYVEVLHAETA